MVGRSTNSGGQSEVVDFPTLSILSCPKIGDIPQFHTQMGWPGWPHGFTHWAAGPKSTTSCQLPLDGHRGPQVWWPWPAPVIKDPRGTQCHQNTRMSNSKQVHTHWSSRPSTFTFDIIWHRKFLSLLVKILIFKVEPFLFLKSKKVLYTNRSIWMGKIMIGAPTCHIGCIPFGPRLPFYHQDDGYIWI